MPEPSKKLLPQFGLVSILLLTLAFSGLAILLLNVTGIAGATQWGVPQVDDLRPLLISSLGFVIAGLTPLMVRLMLEDAGRREDPEG